MVRRFTDLGAIIVPKIEKAKGPNGPVRVIASVILAIVVGLVANILINLMCFTLTVIQVIANIQT